MLLEDRVVISIAAPGWTVTGANVRERLSQPFLAIVDLASDAGEMDVGPLLGTSIEIAFRRGPIEQRVAGIVTSVRQRHERGWRSVARITIEPALAALQHRRDSRIFQHMSVPQILEQVLGEDLRAFGREARQILVRTYPPREYTVQYQETDFDFVHRLMEEEGIVYFFAHEGGPEVMTLVDRNASHPELAGPNGNLLTYDERVDAVEPDRVQAFEPVARIVGTRVTTRHFDWTHPSVPIEHQRSEGEARASLESYLHDAPVTYYAFDHAYGSHNAGDQTQLLRELQARDARLVEAQASAIGVRAGCRFELAGHPRPELNEQFLIVDVEHRFLAHGVESTSRAYSNRFSCVPASVQWRPSRVHARPRISSIQTATIVGPAGEEIHTDPHGRVKVHFHWDRLGRRDDHDSCWIRVAQTMGGAGWGFSFIPRIGMEVVVSFVEGDPDRPIVTGCVFNSENTKPLDLPANKTRLTLKSNSSPGGGGFNEMRLEDKAGSEEIYLQAQKDWNILVKHDKTMNVGNDETSTVACNRTRKVGMNETISVGMNTTRTIGLNHTHSVGVDEIYATGANRTRSVGADETITIGANRTEKVGAKQSTTIGKDCTEKIGGKLSVTVSKSSSQKIGKSFTQKVGMTHTVAVGAMATMNVVGAYMINAGLMYTVNVGLNASLKAGGKMNLKAKGEMNAKAGGMMQLETADAMIASAGTWINLTAPDGIELVCGGSKIAMTSDSITITSTTVTIEAASKVDVTGGIIDLNC